MNLNREHWDDASYGEFFEYLCGFADAEYAEFNRKITPGAECIIGVRAPIIRRIAREIGKGAAREFLAIKKGISNEERQIDGLVAAGIKCGYGEMLELMKRFTDEITNWAICDTVAFKGLKQYKERFLDDAEWFIYNENPWAVRFGFLCLMKFCLEDEYIDRIFEYTASVDSDFYYVEMMQAWLVATAFPLFRDKTVEFLASGKLNTFTTNAAVQKIRDSFKVSREDKELVKKFKRHNK